MAENLSVYILEANDPKFRYEVFFYKAKGILKQQKARRAQPKGTIMSKRVKTGLSLRNSPHSPYGIFLYIAIPPIPWSVSLIAF